MLQVIPRDKSFVAGYKAYCREFHDNHIQTFVPMHPDKIDDGWFDRTAAWYARKERESFDGYPKGVHYWAVDGERFIGEFQLRLELTEQVMLDYSSIGYSVRVTEQGKGYGNEILRQGLVIARGYGLEKVLLNINADNSASIRVCEKNGGVLWDELMLESKTEAKRLVRRYWIVL